MKTSPFKIASVLALLLAITNPAAGQTDPAEPPPGDEVPVAGASEPDPEAGGTGGAVPGILAGPVTNAANGHVYYLLTSANWTDSQTQAQALGGHLTTINNAAEGAWVYSTFSSYGGTPRALWIGLSDAVQEGLFVWADGDTSTYRNWSPGEPNNFNTGQDYVNIFPPGDSRAGTWDDQNNVTNLPDVPSTPAHGVVEIIPNSPPLITSQPQNRVASLGAPASFTVGAGGTAPLSYQWYFSNAPVAGATASTLELANVQFANAGDYHVVVSNLLGSVTSSNATLAVVSLPSIGVFDDPLFVDTGNTTSSESDNIQASIQSLGYLTQPFTDIVAATTQYSILVFPEFEVGDLAAALSPAARSALNNFVASGGHLLLCGSHTQPGRATGFLNSVLGLATSGLTETTGVAFGLTSAAVGTAFFDDPASLPANNGSMSLQAATLPAGSRSIYELSGRSLVSLIPYSAGKVAFLGWDWFDAAPSGTLNSGWLTVLESALLERTPNIPSPPTISTQPQDVTQYQGFTATFTVNATGNPFPRYQWRFDGTDIVGATNFSLVLTNLTTNQAGIYSVIVSNDLGSVTSSNATLTVIDLGQNLFDDFDPGIDGPQWSAFSGTVLATNHGGFISGPNSLWFGGAGSRFAATRSLDTLIGGDISFYLRFGNATNPWERVDLPGEGVALEYSRNQGATWTNISTYNTSNFLTSWVRVEVPVPVAAQSGNTRFRWRQLANSGSVSDHWALDDVSIILAPTPPTFSAQPTNQFAAIGTNVTITAGVRGSRPLTFQWRFNGADLPGATNASLVLSNVQPSQVGLYSVAVANAYGSATSDAMLLLVAPPISSLTVPALDTGWYDSTGFHGPTSGNYMAGDTTSLTRVPPYRNFFVFNVPNFSNEVATARLRVRTFNIASPTGSEDFELNEVTTPIGVLREGGSNRVAVWEDLADGPVYGTRTFTTAERSNLVDITLSPAAVTGIMAARGTGFALGGEITSLDATFRNNEFVFGSSTSGSATNAFLVVNFVPPPSPPALSALPDQTIDEDSVLGPLTFAVYDAQTAASNLTLVTTSSNPALVPDASIVIGGTEIVRSLTITPAANQHGTTVISIIATDGDGNSTTNQFTLTVLPINDPPVADAGATVLTHISPNNVDAQVILDGSLSSDVDGDALTYAWRDGNTDALLGSGVVAIITRPIGANPIVLAVSDGQTNDTTTITVVVKSAAQAVGDLISFLNGVTVPRNKQPLLASLEAAMASFADGNFTAAVNQLEAFQNKVRAQVGPEDPVLADTLISLAQQIIDAIVPPTAPPAGLLRTEMSVTAVKHLPNGRVKLHFPGWASRVYLIQASSDLVTWETIGTGRHLDRGAFEFEDAQAAQRGHRYYRIVMP